MKLSLDSIGYGGYFTFPGESATLEEAMRRAARFGYDAVCIYAHRPIGFPMDLDPGRRKRLRELAGELDLEFGAVVCCTNFQEGNHVLLYPQEKEILYVRSAIDLAKDVGAGIVRVLAAFQGYFQNPYAAQGYGSPAFEPRSRRVSRNEDFLERLWLIFFLAGLPSAAADMQASSFVVFDQVVEHRGDKQLYRNWDFQTGLATNPKAPTDWLAPESPLFDEGLYQFRVEVRRMERPLASPIHVQFGWWNLPNDPVIRHIAGPPLVLSNLEPPAPGKPWVYEAVGTVRSLDGKHMYYGAGPERDKHVFDWDWRHAFAPNSAYTLVNPRDNNFDADLDGKITEAEYPDIEMRCVVTIHGPGSPLHKSLAARLGKPARRGFMLRTIDTTTS